MRHVAILVAASHDESFYSQIAAIVRALTALPWRRWQPSVHAYFGETQPAASWHRWAHHLRMVNALTVPRDAFERDGNWAQVDAAFSEAPSDADVVMSLDADTLPVAGFEDLLDRVAEEDLIAGVMAHYPPPGVSSPADWERLATGIISRPLVFDQVYSLVPPDRVAAAPFYVNGGVMFCGRRAFDRLAPLYLAVRKELMPSLVHEAFSGQIAVTLAVTEASLNSRVLPMRFNFPNDPAAEQLHPHEAERVVIHHYLRTDRFDRHKIFATAEEFDAFVAQELSGPHRRFRDAVRDLLGPRYPFD